MICTYDFENKFRGLGNFFTIVTLLLCGPIRAGIYHECFKVSTSIKQFWREYLSYWTNIHVQKISSDQVLRFSPSSRNFVYFVRFSPYFCTNIFEKSFIGKNFSSDKVLVMEWKFRQLCLTNFRSIKVSSFFMSQEVDG